mmetsp:Transcript_40262/g.91662  ORF Transcript_40262/g.91662 Transcript_40262/m.91662 type:complete len:201 (-) Transcript_40262:92-694(-)
MLRDGLDLASSALLASLVVGAPNGCGDLFAPGPLLDAVYALHLPHPAHVDQVERELRRPAIEGAAQAARARAEVRRLSKLAQHVYDGLPVHDDGGDRRGPAAVVHRRLAQHLRRLTVPVQMHSRHGAVLHLVPAEYLARVARSEKCVRLDVLEESVLGIEHDVICGRNATSHLQLRRLLCHPAMLLAPEHHLQNFDLTVL